MAAELGQRYYQLLRGMAFTSEAEVGEIEAAINSGRPYELAVAGLARLKNSDVPFAALTHPRCVEVAVVLQRFQAEQENYFKRMGISVLLGGSMLSGQPVKGEGDIDLAVVGQLQWLEIARTELTKLLKVYKQSKLDIFEVNPNDFDRYADVGGDWPLARLDSIYSVSFNALQILHWRPVIAQRYLPGYQEKATRFLQANHLAAATVVMHENYLLRKRGLIE